jgi:putative DNA primase/helicase
MNLHEAISAAGMTPPRHMPEGRFVRFPGAGKRRGNTAGWCRVISPTLAVFGDWSTGLTETWRDHAHRDTEESRRLLAEAQRREREYRLAQQRRQHEAAQKAQALISAATKGPHPYLARKGFAQEIGFVHEGNLIIPMRDVNDDSRILSAQLIDRDGGKKFLPGGRAKGAIYRMGRGRPWLCEGYATGLTLREALLRLPGPNQIVVCFSAGNLEAVADYFPGAVVCADNDESKAGEEAAKRTGLPYTLPPDTGTDFNDMHQSQGIYAVINRLRGL